jgi:hypothetical protein
MFEREHLMKIIQPVHVPILSSSCPVPFGSDALLFENPMASIVSLPTLPPEPEPLMDWYESAEVTETLESFVKDHLTKTWERKRSS